MRTFWIIGCLFAMLAVIAGAFGAHALEGRLPPDLLAVFDTAARYQMYHALSILLIAAAADRLDSRLANLAGWLFVAGIVLFAGSLYMMAFTGIRWLGAVTPLGGLCFIAGWINLVRAGWQR